jgi:hypothetical protein
MAQHFDHYLPEGGRPMLKLSFVDLTHGDIHRSARHYTLSQIN